MESSPSSHNASPASDGPLVLLAPHCQALEEEGDQLRGGATELYVSTGIVTWVSTFPELMLSSGQQHKFTQKLLTVDPCWFGTAG